MSCGPKVSRVMLYLANPNFAIFSQNFCKFANFAHLGPSLAHFELLCSKLSFLKILGSRA